MKKPTLTIGICAYNEARSIKQLLLSLKKQKVISYYLSQVIVISDGSSDETIKKASEIAWKKLLIVNSIVRKGKPARLNSLFHSCNTDLLVTLDADVIITDPLFIEKIVKGLTQNTNTCLISANATPLKGKTFLEKSINNYYAAREYYRPYFDYGNTFLGCRGTCVGFTKKFYSHITLPKDLANDDTYMYLLCKKHKYGFKQVKNANVYFKSPDNVSDFISQMVRYIKGGNQLTEYFTSGEINASSNLPFGYKTRLAIHQIRKNLLGYLYLKFLIMCSQLSARRVPNVNAKWLMISSSKFADIESPLSI